jgi:hypothetical protein
MRQVDDDRPTNSRQVPELFKKNAVVRDEREVSIPLLFVVAVDTDAVAVDVALKHSQPFPMGSKKQSAYCVRFPTAFGRKKLHSGTKNFVSG